MTLKTRIFILSFKLGMYKEKTIPVLFKKFKHWTFFLDGDLYLDNGWTGDRVLRLKTGRYWDKRINSENYYEIKPNGKVIGFWKREVLPEIELLKKDEFSFIKYID